MIKVRIKKKVFEVPFEVKNGHLYNPNTQKYEGADGDIVTIIQYGVTERGHVKGYTNYQIVPTYEWPTRVVSACGLHDGTCKIEFEHRTPVTIVNEE